MNEFFTYDYLRSEVVNFRQLFGSRDFWNKSPEVRGRAIKALYHVYFNLEPKIGNEAADLIRDTMFEYAKRETMLFLGGQTSIE